MGNEVSCLTLLHILTKSKEYNFKCFNPKEANKILKEVVEQLDKRNDLRCLENYAVGFLLNQMPAKAIIKKHGIKVV